MFDLMVTALAVLWAWEFLLVLLPFAIPAPIQPLLVFGLAYGSLYLPSEVRLAGGIAGAVAILHVIIRALAQADLPPVQARRLIRPRNRVPDLP